MAIEYSSLEEKDEISSLEMSCDHSLGCSELLGCAHGSSLQLCDASPAQLPRQLHTANPSTPGSASDIPGELPRSSCVIQLPQKTPPAFPAYLLT